MHALSLDSFTLSTQFGILTFKDNSIQWSYPAFQMYCRYTKYLIQISWTKLKLIINLIFHEKLHYFAKYLLSTKLIELNQNLSVLFNR